MGLENDWDVLLIGGGGAVGKTQVAKRLARRLRIDCLQADDVRLVLQRAVSADFEPALHFFLMSDIARVDLSEALAMQEEISRYVSHKLEVVVAHHVATRSRLIIEGDAILPELATADTHAGVRTGGRVRAVFVEEQDAKAVYRALHGRARGSADDVRDEHWARFHHAHGALLAERARGLGIPVVPAHPRRSIVARGAQALGV